MAIRYAGDAEIQIRWTGKQYLVRFKSACGLKGKGTLSPGECRLSQKDSRSSSEAYDKVAQRVAAFLRLKGVRVGEVRRVFQAPCPVPLMSRHHV